MSVGRQVEELVSWQRMHELRVEIWKATELELAERDVDFRDDIRDAVDAAERNIAEGFGRFNALVFANFLEFSRASACEARSLLRKGVASEYFTTVQFDQFDRLALRALRAVASFQRFLRSPAAKHIVARRYPRPYTAPRTDDARASQPFGDPSHADK
jgi:four helix bundle protein